MKFEFKPLKVQLKLIILRRVKTGTNMNLGFTSDNFSYNYQSGTNRLVQVDGYNGTTDRNYTYDANGNLLTDDSKTISATQYVRGSYANQITKTGGDQITYQYDASDLRFYKKVVAAGVTTEEMYLKDAAGRELAVVKWVGVNGTPETEFYVNGTNRIAMVVKDASPNAQVTQNEATFFLYDHLGNTRVAFKYDNALPTVVNAVDYYPYGKILRESDFGNGDRYLTTAHERDRETGLDYRGARYYDCEVARFLSTDPWAAKYPQWSTYNYVMGNPLRFTDPTGKGPGDIFKTTDEAAKDWAKTYAEKSIKKDREFGSTIYEVEVDGEIHYSYTRAKKGSDHDVDPRKPKNGETVVADIHSHGAYKPKIDNSKGTEPLDIGEDFVPIDPGVDANDEFSDVDLVGNILDDKVDGYLVTPRGNLKFLDYETREVKHLESNLFKDPKITE